MDKVNIFDVLVVYTEIVAASATSTANNSRDPFSNALGREHYGVAYAYFLDQCRKIGLKAAFTTSADIIGPGECGSYWEFKDKKWHKVYKKGFAPIIFDKVSSLSKIIKDRLKLLFSEEAVPFNDPKLLILFNDKLKTFERLSEFTIPTVSITNKTIQHSIAKLERLVAQHKNKDDFSSSFVLKDRFGAGGIDIYKIDKNPLKQIAKILAEVPNITFILQPFTKFKNGYKHKNKAGRTDIRIIYSQGEVVQRYIRTAKEADFRCNEHQGGKVIYITEIGIPEKMSLASDAIVKAIKGESALFALDFIISNNGNVYFLEGNINPGIYWGLNSTEDKINTKKLILMIVKEMKRRTDSNFLSSRILPKITPLPKFPLLLQ